MWGQDHVLDQVQENIVFLEKPEEIESKGGHVPGGILLWGPPGTGKTLMAEAVAGETGQAVRVRRSGRLHPDMFMGVGIMKVKSLFRKLRKLALRYGGVIVFFDEADSLGNRGGAGGRRPPRRPAARRRSSTASSATAATTCRRGAQHGAAASTHWRPTRRPPVASRQAARS